MIYVYRLFLDCYWFVFTFMNISLLFVCIVVVGVPSGGPSLNVNMIQIGVLRDSWGNPNRGPSGAFYLGHPNRAPFGALLAGNPTRVPFGSR